VRRLQHERLQLNVQPKSRHRHRTAVAVVRRIDDVLYIRGDVESLPHVHGVVALENVLPPAVQRTVSDDESRATESKIASVPARDSIRRGSNAEAESGVTRSFSR